MPPRKKQRTIDAAPSIGVNTPATTQRVTRAASKAKTQAATAHASARRSKTTTKKEEGTSKRVILKGRLRSLPDFALEIQLEIYSYLEPRDLHHLSRTCKKFRAFFLNRKMNESLWTQARKNADNLPECPPFMSEPAFIHLLYSQNCHFCGAPNVRSVLCSYFTRVCSACYPKVTTWNTDASSAAYKIDPKRYPNESPPGLHHIFLSGVGCVYDYFDLLRNRRVPDQRSDRIPTTAVETVLQRYEALEKPITLDARREFFKTLRDEFTLRSKYARSIESWLDQCEGQRWAALDDAREQRFEAICARLRESEWSPELEFMGTAGLNTMSNLPVVRQSSKLTEGAWRKVMVVLEPFLEETRAKRLRAEQHAAFRARFAALEDVIASHCVTIPRKAHMDCRPQYIDLAFVPEIRAIIDVPTSQAVTAEHFADIVPRVVENWLAERKQTLTDYIRPHLGKVDVDVDPLTLAISVFACKDLRYGVSLTRYPAIFAPHYNLEASNPYYDDEIGFRAEHARKERVLSEEHCDVYTRLTKTAHWSSRELETRDSGDTSAVWYFRKPFSLDRLTGEEWLAASVVRRMRDIVSAVGLDPARATLDDLENCDVWLRCAACEASYPDASIKAFSWRGAYSHVDEAHRSGWSLAGDAVPQKKPVPPEWKRADAEDMAKVYAHLQEASWNYNTPWSCTQCPTFDARTNDMQKHLKDVHEFDGNVSQARQDGLVYLHPSWYESGAMSLKYHTQIVLREAVRPTAW
ncbi:hypothetical protein C8Q77DRAFT_1133246 [Trametes polyzona]|nr:hypothetical protein C8Q77DRAFT_1133246 [Trametes polyzona]